MHTYRGFTLIELLVVIAIIGILSSVVLASLNTARNKAADTAIKNNIHNARAQAENYYDSNGNSYGTGGYSAGAGSGSGICNGPTIAGVRNISNSFGSINANGGSATCSSTPTTWILYSPLKTDSTKYWCTDYTGTSTQRTGAPGTNSPC